MKVADCLLCIGCDELYPINLDACPSCLSEQAIPLTRMIEPMQPSRGIELVKASEVIS
jgi:hypothetical protein